MSSLANAVTGRQARPEIHTIYGVPGVGKTTFASEFPNPIFLDLENGSSHLNVTRLNTFPKYENLLTTMNDLLNDKHNYQTVVIDSLEAMEDLIQAQICQADSVDSIEKACGGFAKGYIRAAELTRDFMKLEQQLANKRGLTIVNIGHAVQKSFADASDSTQYDRYVMRLHHKMAAVVFEMSDNVYFAKHKVYTSKEMGKTKAFGDGERVMFTSWRPGFDAKNRNDLPYEMSLDYQALKKALENTSPQSVELLRENILAMIPGLPKDIQAVATEQTKKAKSAQELTDIKNRVMELVKKTA